MKTENILKQINLLPNKRNKLQVNTLIQALKMLTELKSEIKHSQRSPAGLFNFGRETRIHYGYWRNNSDLTIINEGDEVLSECFIFKTATGTYKNIVPVNNELHDHFCKLVGNEDVKESPLYSFTFNKSQSDKIKRAAKIKDKYSLSEFNGILRLSFIPGECRAQITDGYRLYNERFKSIAIDFNQVLYIKTDNLTGMKGEIILSIFTDYYTLNGSKFEFITFEREYYEFSNIWPENPYLLTVNKKELSSALKQCIKISGFTKRIDFEFNGCLKMTTENVDYNQNLDLRINYKFKKGDDLSISFNGSYLLELISILDCEDISISYTAANNKPIVINDCLMLMPVKNTSL
jgi:hypothetical protein